MVHLMLVSRAVLSCQPTLRSRPIGTTSARRAKPFYGKLNRMEPNVSAAVVAHVAERAELVIVRLGARQAESIVGYAPQIVNACT